MNKKGFSDRDFLNYIKIAIIIYVLYLIYKIVMKKLSGL